MRDSVARTGGTGSGATGGLGGGLDSQSTACEDFPETVISISIEPRTNADREKLAMALRRMAKDDPTFKADEAYIKLARAYARKGKLKDAAEHLRRAPISLTQLQSLADDPEFRELRDSKYGKEAFGLK